MANSRIENVKEQGREAAADAGQAINEAKGAAKEAAGNLGQQARDIASSAADKARDLAKDAGSTAREYASKAGDKAEDALHSVGQGMSTLAGTIREKAPHDGPLSSAAGTVAEQLDAGGRYLREHDFGDIGKDVSNVVRRYPIASLMCVFGVGVLMGTALRR
jgi:cell division septum initiation protein DivIVA